jgi:hypothetical protein
VSNIANETAKNTKTTTKQNKKTPQEQKAQGVRSNST